MSYRTIRDAQQAIWPALTRSIRLHQDQRQEVARWPGKASTAAKTRANKPWNRVIADETVWAIAKADLLATPEHAAVVTAAKVWAKLWEKEYYVEDMHPDEKALYLAVQELASSLRAIDDVE